MNTADYLLGSTAGDAVALLEGDREYSYEELRAAASGWASRLAELDLPRGTAIALMAQNGLFYVSAYLAILSAGHVAVPIPFTSTLEELLARMAWVESPVVFLGRRQGRLAGGIPQDRTVFGEWDAPSAASAVLPMAAALASDDAVLAFTSGTTGRPRVVRHTHGNIQANTESILGYLGLTGSDRILVVLPFAYVFGASLLHTHLRVGASMVMQNSAVYPEAVVDRLERDDCTGFAGVPSTYHLLLRNSSFARRRLPSLRTIQQAGGKLPPVLIEELIAAQSHARIFVMYGQTEATARLSYLPPERLLDKLGSIGRGIPGVRLEVLGDQGRPVAAGEVGEIWAEGANISPGYLKDPAATAEKFPRGRLRTGDLATVDDDGFIYVVDRLEDFIKPWGFRVASQDVEAVAMQLPGLVAAAAVGVPDEAAGERVELVVVKRPDADLDADQVLDHCRRTLATHMVPRQVHFRQQLPLNVNGKVAKGELREWCLAQASEQTAPRSE